MKRAHLLNILQIALCFHITSTSGYWSLTLTPTSSSVNVAGKLKVRTLDNLAVISSHATDSGFAVHEWSPVTTTIGRLRARFVITTDSSVFQNFELYRDTRNNDVYMFSVSGGGFCVHRISDAWQTENVVALSPIFRYGPAMRLLTIDYAYSIIFTAGSNTIWIWDVRNLTAPTILRQQTLPRFINGNAFHSAHEYNSTGYFANGDVAMSFFRYDPFLAVSSSVSSISTPMCQRGTLGVRHFDDFLVATCDSEPAFITVNLTTLAVISYYDITNDCGAAYPPALERIGHFLVLSSVFGFTCNPIYNLQDPKQPKLAAKIPLSNTGSSSFLWFTDVGLWSSINLNTIQTDELNLTAVISSLPRYGYPVNLLQPRSINMSLPFSRPFRSIMTSLFDGFRPYPHLITQFIHRVVNMSPDFFLFECIYETPIMVFTQKDLDDRKVCVSATPSATVSSTFTFRISGSFGHGNASSEALIHVSLYNNTGDGVSNQGEGNAIVTETVTETVVDETTEFEAPTLTIISDLKATTPANKLQDGFVLFGLSGSLLIAIFSVACVVTCGITFGCFIAVVKCRRQKRSKSNVTNILNTFDINSVVSETTSTAPTLVNSEYK